MTDASATPEEICAAACADAFAGDGEILVQTFGNIPRLGVGLAKLTSNPDLLMTDGAAMLLSEPLALGSDPARARIEGWLPFRAIFDTVWSGRRHVMMGTAQIDRHGNTNISAIGAWRRPRVQLLGCRGAPGNTANNAVSYWIPNHSPRVFRESVDVVTGIGADADPSARVYQDLRRVVTNLAVFDFGGHQGSMRLVSVHPWTTPGEVEAATGFDLDISDRVEQTRVPGTEELDTIRRVLDPRGLRVGEVPC